MERLLVYRRMVTEGLKFFATGSAPKLGRFSIWVDSGAVLGACALFMAFAREVNSLTGREAPLMGGARAILFVLAYLMSCSLILIVMWAGRSLRALFEPTRAVNAGLVRQVAIRRLILAEDQMPTALESRELASALQRQLIEILLLGLVTLIVLRWPILPLISSVVAFQLARVSGLVGDRPSLRPELDGLLGAGKASARVLIRSSPIVHWHWLRIEEPGFSVEKLMPVSATSEFESSGSSPAFQQ